MIKLNCTNYWFASCKRCCCVRFYVHQQLRSYGDGTSIFKKSHTKDWRSPALAKEEKNFVKTKFLFVESLLERLRGKGSEREWTLSIDSVDDVHALSGRCPCTQWTMSMHSVESVHGFS